MEVVVGELANVLERMIGPLSGLWRADTTYPPPAAAL